MPRPLTPSYSESFLGLSLESPTEIGEQQAAELDNLYIWDNGKELVRRGGTSKLAGTTDAIAFEGLFFARISSIDHLIGVHGGALQEWYPSAGGSLLIGGHSLTAGKQASAAFLPSALYLGNGIDQNLRFDGSNVKTVMCSKPTSGTAAVGFGSGGINGIYTYRITFLSADGNDSQASDVNAPTPNLSGSASIHLTNIPVAPAGEDCSGRRIWRTTNGGSTWYLVGTINNNTATTFTDATLDTAIDTSQAIDLAAVRFPPCAVLVAHQNRLCAVLCSTSEGDTHTLYVSDYLQPWRCAIVPPLDEVDDPTLGARIALPDTPTGLVSYGNVLVIWFQNQAWTLRGDNPNNWSLDRWLDVGCVSHRTARVYRSALIWLGPDGVYSVEGIGESVQVRRISDDIRSDLDTKSAAELALAHAFVWSDRYYLCFPGSAYYYDFNYHGWGKLTNWTWVQATVTQQSGSQREQIYATPTDLGQVKQLETGDTDDGTLIPVRWKSRDKDMGQMGREKRVHRIIARFKRTSGMATINLYRGGGDLIQTLTQDISVGVRDGSSVSELAERCVEQARDEFFAVEVTHPGDGNSFRLLDIGTQWSLCT